MIYLCTANLENKTQHNFYCGITKKFYGIDVYRYSTTDYYEHSVVENCYVEIKPFKYVLPDILNIVDYEDFFMRLEIINNILDKKIFENI
jgi:hypothetical protein